MCGGGGGGGLTPMQRYSQSILQPQPTGLGTIKYEYNHIYSTPLLGQDMT